MASEKRKHLFVGSPAHVSAPEMPGPKGAPGAAPGLPVQCGSQGPGYSKGQGLGLRSPQRRQRRDSSVSPLKGWLSTSETPRAGPKEAEAGGGGEGGEWGRTAPDSAEGQRRGSSCGPSASPSISLGVGFLVCNMGVVTREGSTKYWALPSDQLVPVRSQI